MSTEPQNQTSPAPEAPESPETPASEPVKAPEAATELIFDSFLDMGDMPSMDNLLDGQQEEATQFVEGTIIDGTIVGRRNDGAIVDIGYKAEGFVPAEEFPNWREVKVGDKVSVLLEQLENEDNMPGLSLQKAMFSKAWEKITSENEEGGVVKGLLKSRVKGGMIVDISGVEAFLPGSQIDISPVRNMDDLVGQTLEMKILKINNDRKNIVVSRRELLEEIRAEKRSTLLKDMTVNQVRAGQVKNITDFGAFVDLGGVDGLLHITDMSWGRISHPSEMLAVGQEIEVMVLDIDYERERVSLGLKQKSENPWDEVERKYPAGTKVKGRVVNLMPYGAFVEIESGIEGLIHVSEMSWTKRVSKAGDVLSVGEEVEAVVLDIKKDSKKISLGLRQKEPNPWMALAERCPPGTRIKGKVRNMTSYGAFVQIEGDIDGMIHVSDMSWTRKINNPSEVLKAGEEIEALILDIDPEQQRISLGLKQIEDDPWSKIDTIYKIGDLVKGKVSKIMPFGAFVELGYNIDGLIHISQLSKERVEKVKDVVNIGDDIEARIIKIDNDNRRIGLSIKAVDEEFSEEDMAEAEEEFTAGSALRPGADMVAMGELMGNTFDALSPADKATEPAAVE